MVEKASKACAKPNQNGASKSRAEQYCPCPLYPQVSSRSLGLERGHVDGEAVFDIGLGHAVVSFVNLLDGDDFNVSGDVVLAAEVEHFLGLGDAADGRARQAAASQEEGEGGDRVGLLGRADDGQVAVNFEQVEISVDVVRGSRPRPG